MELCAFTRAMMPTSAARSRLMPTTTASFLATALGAAGVDQHAHRVGLDRPVDDVGPPRGERRVRRPEKAGFLVKPSSVR